MGNAITIIGNGRSYVGSFNQGGGGFGHFFHVQITILLILKGQTGFGSYLYIWFNRTDCVRIKLQFLNFFIGR